MNQILVRLAAAIGIVVLVQVSLDNLRLRPHETIPPRLELKTFPVSFDTWVSEDELLDPVLFANTKADVALSRKYHDASGHVVSFFMAQYSDVQSGLYHNPFNCYQSGGFTNVSEEFVKIVGKKRRQEIDVSVSIWEQSGQKVMVMYWYELGDQVAYSRSDGDKLRKAFQSKKRWAPMYKVLMQTPVTDKPAEAKEVLCALASKARDMLGDASPPMDD